MYIEDDYRFFNNSKEYIIHLKFNIKVWVYDILANLHSTILYTVIKMITLWQIQQNEYKIHLSNIILSAL